jgi:thiamine biosynthesis lipoprotein
VRRLSSAVPFLLAVLGTFTAACSATPRTDGGEERVIERVGLAMGSELRLTAFTSDATAAATAFNAVLDEFDRLDHLLSVWKPGSDVQRVNEAAGLEAVHVGPDLLDVLEAARQVSEWTDGKFDVTFAALADVWKFDHDQDNTVPTREQIEARRPLIDYRNVIVDRSAATVFLAQKGMRIHLGGIGKGYAVDRAARLLRNRGLTNFMIQSGGDLYVAGLLNGQPWRLGIADPRDPSKTFGTLDLSDGTFSTSGDYERAFLKEGRRYHHLLDPATGEPARGCRSVTIVANSPLLADGLSTGVFILGPERGMALVERLPDVEAVIISSRNEVLVSSGLRGRFHQLSTPTDGP